MASTGIGFAAAASAMSGVCICVFKCVAVDLAGRKSVVVRVWLYSSELTDCRIMWGVSRNVGRNNVKVLIEIATIKVIIQYRIGKDLRSDDEVLAVTLYLCLEFLSSPVRFG